MPRQERRQGGGTVRKPGLITRLQSAVQRGLSRSAAVRQLRAEGFRFGSDRIRGLYNLFKGRHLTSPQQQALRFLPRNAGGFSQVSELQAFRIRYRAVVNYDVNDLRAQRNAVRRASTSVVQDIIIPIGDDILRLRDVALDDFNNRALQVVHADIRNRYSGQIINSPRVAINIRTSQIHIETGTPVNRQPNARR